VRAPPRGGGGRSFPRCIDFLPDARLVIVDSARRRLLRREPDGSLIQHAVIAQVSDKPWNGGRLARGLSFNASLP